jgi:hypothetical protein
MRKYIVTRDEFDSEYPIAFWDISLRNSLEMTAGQWNSVSDNDCAELDISYPEFQRNYGALHIKPGEKKVMVERYDWEVDYDAEIDMDVYGYSPRPDDEYSCTGE